MAGYSGTPLFAKLGIRPHSRVALVKEPDDFEATLGALPGGTELLHPADGEADVIILFTTSLADLADRFPWLKAILKPDGGFWVAWPKRASKIPTDLSENVIREVGLAQGMVDNKVCAIDETWSGLRFVYRLRDRPAPGAKKAANSPTRAPAARRGRARGG